MPNRYAVAQNRSSTPLELWRQPDLGHQEQCGTSTRNGTSRGAEIDLGLAAACHAMQEDRTRVSARDGFANRNQGRGLVRGEPEGPGAVAAALVLRGARPRPPKTLDEPLVDQGSHGGGRRAGSLHRFGLVKTRLQCAGPEPRLGQKLDQATLRGSALQRLSDRPRIHVRSESNRCHEATRRWARPLVLDVDPAPPSQFVQLCDAARPALRQARRR